MTSFLIAFLSVETQSQSQLDLKNKPVNNALLAEILNNSQMKELTPPSPKLPNLFLRLYSIGVSGTCEPDTETEVICSFRYYLAVNDGSLGVSGVVYDLGEIGEITEIQWLDSPDSNIDKLRIEISNYPTQAIKHNPKLVRKTRSVDLDVSLTSLKVRAIK